MSQTNDTQSITNQTDRSSSRGSRGSRSNYEEQQQEEKETRSGRPNVSQKSGRQKPHSFINCTWPDRPAAAAAMASTAIAAAKRHNNKLKMAKAVRQLHAACFGFAFGSSPLPSIWLLQRSLADGQQFLLLLLSAPISCNIRLFNSIHYDLRQLQFRQQVASSLMDTFACQHFYCYLMSTLCVCVFIYTYIYVCL